ncbi:MAG TPA: DUF1611 domain-containing protein [bacterium]|nr:DUF1611 domain-containing protein [bacterium]
MDGTAIILCEGNLTQPTGKTAHGLIRGTERYRILGVIDSENAGKDAGLVLDKKPNGIPIFKNLETAIENLGGKPDYLVFGIAPDGGMLPEELKPAIITALQLGINVDCGLHQPLGDDAELAEAARVSGATIRDVRKCKPVSELHFFEGKIEQVESIRIAILGTDSAIGKRTTAKILLDSLRDNGISTEMVGTGQTAWFQGIPYCMLMDATINDFVAGEIEHAVFEAWKNKKPKVILIEGQGCLTNPAYPGGFEILAAARPHAVIMQHAPKRKVYDGFPDYPLAGLEKEIKLVEMLSNKPVMAVTINHESMDETEVENCIKEYELKYSLPVCDVLLDGADKIIKELENRFPEVTK